MIAARTIHVGAELDLVAPPGHRLSRAHIDSIETALERMEIGDRSGARAVLRKLEDRLGITEHHRIAAASGSPAGPFLLVGDGAKVHQTIRERRAQRETAERSRAIALIPRDAPPLSDKDFADLKAVEMKLAEAQTHKKAGNRRLAKARTGDARRILLNIEHSRLERLNNRWAERVLAEIEALEQAVGGTVERKTLNGGQPMHVPSRDGLYMLSQPTGDGPERAARLNRTQLAAGLAYRALYERTDPERALRPKSIDPADEIVGRGGDGWAEKRAQLWNDRAKIDARVRSVAGERGLELLQEVAGKGRCIAHLAKGGRSRKLATERLILALDEASFALGF